MTVAALLTAAAMQMAVSCDAPNARVSIDHVVIAVDDLDEASATYGRLGFRLKEGRLHANGLENRHIKFEDGTSLELMTVAGEPEDEMAAAYAQYLDSGEGGIYLALLGQQEDVLNAAEQVPVDGLALGAGGFRYVTFGDAGLRNLFTLEDYVRPDDPEALFDHAIGTSGIEAVWMEAGDELGELLLRLGAVRCGTSMLPDGRVGTRYGVAGGEIAIVPPRGERLEVVGLRLRASRGPTTRLNPRETHGIWLEVDPDAR